MTRLENFGGDDEAVDRFSALSSVYRFVVIVCVVSDGCVSPCVQFIALLSVVPWYGRMLL